MEKEIRSNSGDISFEGNRVEGYAIRFNSLSDNLGGFREIIEPSAITEDFLRQNDVFALLNHDTSKVLARCNKGNGSLSLQVTSEGLRYSFILGDTPQAKELRSYLERGEIVGSSFCFSIDKNEDCETWTRDKDNNLIRTIKRFKTISDVSPVFNPAYPTSEVHLRDIQGRIEEVDSVLKALNAEIDNL